MKEKEIIRMQENPAAPTKADSTPLSGGGTAGDSRGWRDSNKNIDDLLSLVPPVTKISDQVKPGPKFKIGDTIRYRWPEKGDDWNKGTIIGIEDGKYLMKDGYVDIEHQDQWELLEEPVSEDLEAEIKRYVYDPYFNLNGVAVKGATEYLTVEDVADIARHFANWQKQQMMKDAKSGTVQKDYQVILDDGAYIDLDPSMQLKPSFAVKEGERVKLIIVRE